MGNIGPIRHRYEVLPVPPVDLRELDRDLIDRTDEQQARESDAATRARPVRP